MRMIFVFSLERFKRILDWFLNYRIYNRNEDRNLFTTGEGYEKENTQDTIRMVWDYTNGK